MEKYNMAYQVTQADVALAREAGAAQAAAPKAALRTGSPFDGGSWNAHTGEVTLTQDTRGQNMSPDLSNARNDNILATARRPTGSPVVGDLRPTDYVRHGGMDMTVREAVRFGLLEAVPGGGFRQVSASGTPDAPKEEVKLDKGYEDGAEAMEQDAEQAFAALVGGVDSGVQYAALNDLTTLGDVSPATLTRIAAQLGTVPEQASALVERVVAGMQRQADAAVAAVGVVDPQAMYAWAKAVKPKELAAAMNAQAAGRSTTAYAKLAREFLGAKASNDTKSFTQSSRGQALQARRGNNGEVVVTVPGVGEVRYEVALKMGLIR
jgi:hypothetical protein